MENPTEKLYDHKGWFWDHIKPKERRLKETLLKY